MIVPLFSKVVEVVGIFALCAVESAAAGVIAWGAAAGVVWAMYPLCEGVRHEVACFLKIDGTMAADVIHEILVAHLESCRSERGLCCGFQGRLQACAAVEEVGWSCPLLGGWTSKARAKPYHEPLKLGPGCICKGKLRRSNDIRRRSMCRGE